MTITDAMPFLVVVDGKRNAMPWGNYSTRGEALNAARKLCALGMHARVVAHGDHPEDEHHHEMHGGAVRASTCRGSGDK